MAHEGRGNNPAMWYYTAAFLTDLEGNATKASYLLGLAENSKSSSYIDESIKVFRIYLDAKLLPYNSSYESRLFTQLNWLDKKLGVISMIKSAMKLRAGICCLAARVTTIGTI